MSSIRGAVGSRGRARGSHFTTTTSSSTPRGPSSTSRDRGSSSPRARTMPTSRGAFGQPARGNSGAAFRGKATARGDVHKQLPSAQAGQVAERIGADGSISRGSWKEREEQLKKFREEEKDYAIANGLMTDPDKQVKVSEAITIVGTCNGMCSENERVTRVNRNEIWDPEKDANGEPAEARMVKAFKRSAAGDEVQLPSDLRPPQALRRTCDYLFNILIANHPLPDVHHFVWDRTRAIRNDFSIQQLTKLEDIRIAIECYERIARFHIMSLHQLALPERPYPQYDSQQEREQLDRTLLSLMQYYDDTRGRIEPKNEAEFKAYGVIFQLRDPIPDLEDRVQSWPRNIGGDRRVQTALQVYAAACSIKYSAGPAPGRPPVIARQDWESFWSLVNSRKVSYLQACVAEVYFMLVREMVLSALIRSSRAGRINGVLQPITDWTIEELWELFNFDEEEELKSFVARWGLEFKQASGDNEQYLDISSLAGRPLPTAKDGPSQLKSALVEDKRHGRTLPAIINGLNVRQAKDAGMVMEEELPEAVEMEAEEEQMADVSADVENGQGSESEDGIEDEDSLFVPESKHHKSNVDPVISDSTKSGGIAASPSGKSNPFTFGQPSGSGGIGGLSQAHGPNPFLSKPAAESASDANNGKKPFFNFLGSSSTQNSSGVNTATSSPLPNPSSLTATSGVSIKPISPFTTPATEPISAWPSGAASPEPGLFRQPTAQGEATSSFAGKKDASIPEKAASSFVEPHSAATSNQQSTTNSATPFPLMNGGDFTGLAKQQHPLKPAAAGAGSTYLQPDLNPKFTSQQQPQLVPSTTSPQIPSSLQSTPNVTVTNAGSQSSARRPSNFQDTKPKKPSPLANSFSAVEEHALPSLAGQTTIASASTEQRSLFTDGQNSGLEEAAQQTKLAFAPSLIPSDPTAEEIFSKLTDELFLSPRNGLLNQYLDFHLNHAITEAQEKVLEERIQARLTILRTRFLRRLYGRRWIENVRKILANRRRVKQKERLERKLNGRDSVAARSSPSLKKSRSVVKTVSSVKQREVVDALFHMTQEKLENEEGVQATENKKSALMLQDSDLSQRGERHKRFKSMDHVDGWGRVAKPAASTDAEADILKRSSFLAFSLAPDAPNRTSTTKSTYFRMKAMGLKEVRPAADVNHLRGIKRPRTDSFEDESVLSVSRARASSLNDNVPDRNPDTLMRPPSSISVRSKTNEDDDVLIARLRAAREALKDGETFMKDQIAKEEELRHSLSRSRSSSESPSMAKARADARLRASRGASELGEPTRGRDLPAYRLRESRFLSREEQALAVERAQEIRASRARQASSRPDSRTEQQQIPEFSETFGAPSLGKPNQAQSVEIAHKKANDASGSGSLSAKPATAASGTQLRESGVLSGHSQELRGSHQFADFAGFDGAQKSSLSRRDPFSQSSSFAHAPLSQNPFLQTNSYDTTTRPSSQRRFPAVTPTFPSSHDHTIAPSQIGNVLAHTFEQQQEVPTPSAQATSRGSATPPQTNSYMHSQAASAAMSLLSDDEESVGNMAYRQDEFFNGMAKAGKAGFVYQNVPQLSTQDAGADLLQGAYAYNNSFAALNDEADQFEDEDDEETAQQLDEDVDEELTGGYKQQRMPESYQYSNDESEEDYDEPADEHERSSAEYDDEDERAPNGHYYGNGEEEDADEEDEGNSYDEDDEDGYGEEDDDADSHHFVRPSYDWNDGMQPSEAPKNPALQGIGGTVEEAIELSD